MRRLLAGVVVLLLVASAASPTIADDSTIAQQLSAELRAAKQSRALQSFRINVKVDDGVVWMQGSVLDAEQRSKALSIARAVPGVRLVVNDLVMADESVPDVAPPSRKSPDGTLALNSKSNPGEEQLASHEATSPRVTMQAAPRKVIRSNSMVSPAAAMGKASPARAVDLSTSKQLEAEFGPELMQAQLIRTQMLQRELAESQAIAAATEQLRRQNAIARNQLVNYCANGGCNAGSVSMGPSTTYGGSYEGQAGDCYSGNCYGGSLGGGDYTGSYGGWAGGNSGLDGGVVYDQAQLPGYAWPSYASYPNYAALSYPKQYSAQAWPYIGPFYPYPQVPLGWRKVCLEWDDGWWMLDFTSKGCH